MSESRYGTLHEHRVDLGHLPCLGHTVTDPAAHLRRDAHLFATALPGP